MALLGICAATGGVHRAHETLAEDELDDGLLAEEKREDNVHCLQIGIASDMEPCDEVRDG